MALALLLPSLSQPVPVHARQTFQKEVGPARPWLRVHPCLQERLQELWDVYQRLGLEDDIVDPSNTLLREGPVLKISFRRSDPIERYLFLVGGCWRPPYLPPHWGGKSWAALPRSCLPGVCLALQEEPGRARFSVLLCSDTWLALDKCCLQASGISNIP